MRRTYTSVVAVAAAATLATGCLQKDTTHTLCLSADGQVTWLAMEGSVRSDTAEPAGRRAEEQDYLAAALAGRHDVALALEALAPVGEVRTTVVKSEAPFFVVTEARFPSVDIVLQKLLEDAPGTVSARLARAGRQSILTVDIDLGADAVEDEGPLAAILADLDSLRFVMTEGRFVAAAGFDIDGGGTVATFSKDWLKRAEEPGANGSIRMTLTWEKLAV
jgi:hypothetical protein